MSAHNFLAMQEFQCRIGPNNVIYPVHDSTKRIGQLLVVLCQEYNLLKANTLFRKTYRRQWTFIDRISGESTQRNTTSSSGKKWMNSVLDVKPYSIFISVGLYHRVMWWIKRKKESAYNNEL